MEPRGIVKAFPKRKKVRDDSGKSVPPKISKEEGTEILDKWLKPVTAYVLQAGIGQARAEIFHKQIVQNGGVVHNQLSLEVTHVIVAEDMDCDRAFRLLKLTKLPSGLQLVKASWLSACIRDQKLLSTTGYGVFIPHRYMEEGERQKEQQQQEACKIPGIGKRMAEKILEILESGHLRKLDHISESVPVLELFSNIWGAGVKTAQMWYQQGFRTLDDIRTKATLTSQQAVGLKHYADFLERMPREEAAEIEQTVRQAALALKPGLVCVACGSYRRGKPTCGDVDVLVTHPDGQSHRGVFSKLLDSLHRSGFLTDDLVTQEDNGDQKKYLGVCRLPGPARHHRRLDIIVVPYSEFACALLYFTGSAHFNRSMRALAKTKGMSLSEHALSSAVVRGPGGVKVASGHTLPTPTEKDVFIQLGLPYREPSERDW
ncbi:DNA polymerase lambda [Gavia stellata]|uniref:DNA polymerase lambda n=1 Tax=Gavia stellata TaxID=37040 RepID=UPI0028A2A3D4|nr:DNA polymerase lambda [Gavia stellata]